MVNAPPAMNPTAATVKSREYGTGLSQSSSAPSARASNSVTCMKKTKRNIEVLDMWAKVFAPRSFLKVVTWAKCQSLWTRGSHIIIKKDQMNYGQKPCRKFHWNYWVLSPHVCNYFHPWFWAKHFIQLSLWLVESSMLKAWHAREVW